MDDLLKYGGTLIAIGTIIYMAGKVRQIVDYLREAVTELRTEAHTFRETIADHNTRIQIIESKRGRK